MQLPPHSFTSLISILTRLLYIFAFSLLLFLLPWFRVQLPCASATLFAVGGDDGWVVGAVNYTQWATNHTFYVGDSLVFKYLPEVHTVLEVTRESYANCNAVNPIARYENGDTTVRLNKAGPYYFICGVYQHCPLGQKLEVEALTIPEISPSLSPAPIAGGPKSSLKSEGTPPGSSHSSVTFARVNYGNTIVLFPFFLVSWVL